MEQEKNNQTSPEEMQEVPVDQALEQERPAQEPEEPSPLEQLQQEFAQLNDRHLRTLAEYDNYRKRTARERESLYPEAQAAALAPLLPVLDNFDRALQTECADETYRKGMELIYQSMVEALQKLGVESIGEAGETFDPLIHNAVMHVEDDAFGENVVCEVFQKGYRMKDKVLRYAMVKVAN